MSERTRQKTVLAGRLYTWDGQDQVLPEPDLKRWDRSLSEERRRVAWQVVPGHDRPLTVVSTVFLGVDHNFSGTGEPILFETIAFRWQGDDLRSVGIERRYVTARAAREGHAAICRNVAARVFYVEVLTNEPAIYQRRVTAYSLAHALAVLRSEAWAYGWVEMREVPQFMAAIPFRRVSRAEASGFLEETMAHHRLGAAGGTEPQLEDIPRRRSHYRSEGRDATA